MVLINILSIVLAVVSTIFVILPHPCEARGVRSIQDPPCYFNPLCTCSKAVPDLGIVRCQDTMLSRIPQIINSSKAFMLELNNVGLRIITPHFLQRTGINKLSITHNPITAFPDDAFMGLERTLWRLDLSNNELLNVPSKALRNLQKLRYLDLTGNAISRIFADSWNGLEKSLEMLILAENSIAHLSPDTFTGLPLLDTINLKGNNLREIDPSVFRDGMDRLAHIILADNQLSSIPYLALSPLKMLKTLDLSYNKINKMFPTMESGSINIQLDVRMSLDVLNLEYNEIPNLESGAFQYFNVLNKTYLDGNQLSFIQENAFPQARIRELYLRSCGLTEVLPAAFSGLENCLQILDLSGNNLTGLENDFLLRFGALQSLSLGDNLLKGFSSMEAINGFQHTLFNLDLSGIRNDPVSLDNLRRMKSLRVLHLSRLTQRSLAMDDLSEFGTDLEELHITFAELQSIKNHALQNLHSLKVLDLSENSINQIENDAFINVGHSLMSLELSHGLSASVNTLPFEALKSLSNLQDLDFSNNRIKTVPENSFHFLKQIRTIQLQDNEIEQIQKGTFQGDRHSHLESIYLSFNNLKTIQQNTFAGLFMLEQLHLDDNQIGILERRSFIDLENLKRLNLKGNKITTIPYESLQNLPDLEDFDISYNQLTDFQFSALDQVGTLATFQVNVSHNKLFDLTPSVNYNLESESGSENFHSNIKILDYSFNNITHINKEYFRPVELSITHLYLSHNLILNASHDIFGNMPHLQWLDLSFNRIMELNYDTFRNTKHLQVLLLSSNHVGDVPTDLFRSLFNLRVVDLSHNRLRFLPENLFKQEGLERLDLSNNQLSRLPLSSISPEAAATLCELDLSYNGISSLAHGGMLSKFESLSRLDLSYNRLVQVDVGIFELLSRISELDLSHNSQLSLDRHGKSFQGIEDSLLFLKLDNLSLTSVPELPLNNLVSLSLAHNALSTIPPEMPTNLSSLRSLNLAHNDLTIVPIVTHSLTHLKQFSLSSNPISILSNTSLLGVANHLESLDITNLPLNVFETGALNKMVYLKTLKLSIYSNVRNFNIPRVLECNFALENLEVEVRKDTDLQSELSGKFPAKLRSLTITGTALRSLDNDILQGVRSPSLYFALQNTGITKVSLSLFDDLHWLRNLSLDIRDNVNLQNFENPLTGAKPGLSTKTFLVDLSMHGNKWICDCDIGWVEIWQRKRRQYLCDSGLTSLPPRSSLEYSCKHVEDDIRNSICVNKANQSLVEVLKTDIECGWSSSCSNRAFSITLILIVVRLLQEQEIYFI